MQSMAVVIIYIYNTCCYSSGTDTYSAIAASLGSLKGPRHGGANIKVMQMFDDIKNKVKDWTSEEEVGQSVDLLNKRPLINQD